MNAWHDQRAQRDAAIAELDETEVPDDSAWEGVPFFWRPKWMGVIPNRDLPPVEPDLRAVANALNNTYDDAAPESAEPHAPLRPTNGAD